MAREVRPLIHPVLRRFITAAAVLIAASGTLHSQETATRFFDRVSERYAAINDYTADLVITRGEVVQRAVVMYKKPNLVRLDFREPNGMVMSVDGEVLKVWVPEYGALFEQPLRKDSQGQIATLTGPGGLELIKKYYSLSYDPSPDLVPLSPGSSEMVTRLKAEWKSNNEGFRRLILSIDSGMKVRRIRGITTTNEEIIFDFTGMVINKGIPDTRFQYQSPPTGNKIENFLFDPEN
jgi:outer membrane lipoprotein-sorting protein